jgi:dihydrofolate synthase/folylpolyglutamate synthase
VGGSLSYEDAVKFIEARGFGIRPDLGRIEALVSLLDHPERSYPTIHLAGTNGKSSTARMIGAILAAHGIKAGVYTSPHLQSIRERFLLAGSDEHGRIASDYISPEQFAAAVTYLAPFIETVEEDRGETVTYFELTTALAFEWMAEAAVGAGIYEAGMGGSWDATNVLQSDVAVLTDIAVDHVNFLGSTPVQNAREKVGIIKSGSLVISARQEPEVDSLLSETVREQGATITFLGKDFDVLKDQLALGGRVATVKGINASYEQLFIPLLGAHQTTNAAVAVAACELFLGKELDGERLQLGMATVQSPGRMEVVRRQPLVVLDGAHNPAAARALGSALVETFGRPRATFILAIFRDKDIRGILDPLLPLAGRLMFTSIGHERSAEAEELAEVATGKSFSAETFRSMPEAVDEALRSSGHDDLVVITGSLHAAGAARDYLVAPVQ